jgi:large subunit ribosomal protein L10
MRAEKQFSQANMWPGSTPRRSSSWSDYRGLKVGPITELRKRLNKAGAEMHVVKNSLFRLAVKEAGVADLNGTLAGQLGRGHRAADISAAAKVVKTFARNLTSRNSGLAI